MRCSVKKGRKKLWRMWDQAITREFISETQWILLVPLGCSFCTPKQIFLHCWRCSRGTLRGVLPFSSHPKNPIPALHSSRGAQGWGEPGFVVESIRL